MTPELFGFIVGALVGARVVSALVRWFAARLTRDAYLAAAVGALSVAALASASWAWGPLPAEKLPVYFGCAVFWAVRDGLRIRRQQRH